MKNSQFKIIGNYLIQMGLYLCTIDVKEFEERTEIKDNIINFLMQSYLYLKTYNDTPILVDNKEESLVEKTDEDYLSRKQVLEIYHPLFTEYGLTQAIHTKGLPYIKRGSKYFFKKSEIDDWIDSSNRNFGNKRIKYV